MTVIGLVIETTDGFRDLPAAWDHTRPSNQTEVVTVGLVANTLEPARLEKLLTRIDLVRQIPHTEIGVSAPPGLLLKELISVASQLRDTAKAGALPDDGKAAVMAACLAVAPSAQFDDMDLAALCAYDLYCRATIPAASRRQSAIAKAAQGYHGRRPEPLPEAVLAREEPRTITGKTTVTAAMPSSRPCRRWRFRQNALPPAPITAPSAAPSPSALRTMRAVQAR
ncbi:hypothetical protein CDN99_23725 [Roseateles aquatilis]|uniref:Uncharacterized protein n=1 Tax=Roseateles aquatilis TaxID=431061 RepID=A0A246IWZ9_9BURK|nr:hypothetical protein CDN99_23725 [Roseateles aquatilis]